MTDLDEESTEIEEMGPKKGYKPPTDDPEYNKHPWNRQPGENLKAFQMFEMYRDAGAKRNRREVARKFDCTVIWVNKLAAKHHWIDRITAFESRVAERKAELAIDKRVEMDMRHAEYAKSMLDVAVDRLKKLDPDKIPLTMLPTWIQTAVGIERTALGAANSKTVHEVTGGVNIEVVPYDYGRAIGPLIETVQDDEEEDAVEGEARYLQLPSGED